MFIEEGRMESRMGWGRRRSMRSRWGRSASAPDRRVRRTASFGRALAPIAALGAAAAPAMAQAPTGGLSPLLIQLVPFFVIFLIFYMLLIRPQAKQRREHQAMLAALKKGDEVLTQGGIFGVVVGTKDDVVVLKIAEDTKIEVLKQAITGMRGKPAHG
jgi:preprotein translocase subunit YajC